MRRACEGFRSDHQAEAFCRISSLRSVSARNLILLKTSCSDFSSRRDAANPQHVSRTHMCGRCSLHGTGTFQAPCLPGQHSTTSSGAPVKLGSRLWRHSARFGTLGATGCSLVSDESPCFDSGSICFRQITATDSVHLLLNRWDFFFIV